MGNIKVYSPPQYPYLDKGKSIFLGGSIEMGCARHWQKEFIDLVERYISGSVYNWTILNPRRTDWDSTWKQTLEDPHFYQQVEWELTYLTNCKFKVFCFCANTVSPISLLEFGRFSTTDPESIYLHIEEGYGRKGNLDIYCHKFGIKQFDSLESIVKELRYK